MTVPQASPIAVAVWSVVALWLLVIGLVQAVRTFITYSLPGTTGAAALILAGGLLLARVLHVTRSAR